MKNDRGIPVGVGRLGLCLEMSKIGGRAIGTNPRHPSVFRFIRTAPLEGAVKEILLWSSNAQILSAVIKPVAVLVIYDKFIARLKASQKAVHTDGSIDASPILPADIHTGLRVDDPARECGWPP